ncbi:MAG: rhamnan synthesis F family protein, partial [Eubacteriales bacterium]|nr:rhamnan synthesis F family protein [Eubacteriales bacterium]
PQVIVRENQGFDIWGYKTGLDSIGWQDLAAFDEIILANNTIFGPLYPFRDVFAAMDSRDVDFWGLTRHGEHENDPTGCNPYGFTPVHVQSYFVGFRKSFFQSEAFQSYWDHLPAMPGYGDAVGGHETFFTRHFADLGFAWDTFVDSAYLETLNPNPILYYHQKMVSDLKCPIVKRRTFFQDYDDILFHTTGQPAFELMNWLEQQSGFDTGLIWDNLLRTCHLDDLAKNLHLNYILPTKNQIGQPAAATPRIALVMHLFFPDLVDEMAQYAAAMPAQADIYISTNTEEKRQVILERFAGVTQGQLEVRVTNNRGRDVSSLMVGMREIIVRYDYVCFVHDKKSGQVKPGSIGESFAWKCLRNMLYSPDYVANILRTFADNPRLGLLVPPEPNHSYYFFSLGDEWSWNFDNTRILAQKMGLTVPIAENKRVIAPLGSFFWFRTAALQAHFDNQMNYTDFPEEPLPDDGSVSHALERIYPFVAQQAGYYTGVVMAEDLARLEYTNLRHYVSSYNKSGFDFSIRGPFTLMNAIYHQKFYDAPKWVGIAGERLEHIEVLRREYDRLQAFYEATLDVRLRLIYRRFKTSIKQLFKVRKGNG